MSNAKIRARRRRRALGYKGSPPVARVSFDIETVMPELMAIMPPSFAAVVRQLAKIRNFGLVSW